jgi:hypothetical protein
MSFIQSVIEFFQSIFQASSPEVKKRQEKRKLENDLKIIAPGFYKDGMVQPNFAEVLRVLSINTKPINDLLSSTMCTEDIGRNRRFEEQLLLTGFDSEAQSIIQNMSYEVRKERAREAKSLNRYLEGEHREVEKVARQLNTPAFAKIEAVMNKVKQLNDICKYNYTSTLRLFDPNYQSIGAYTPEYQEIAIDLLETALMDLYYVVADMDISVAVYNALCALYQLYHRTSYTERRSNGIEENLRKLQGIFRHVLTKNALLAMIKLAKRDPDYVPQKAVYEGNYRKKYADFLEERFNVDEKRLKVEIQDEQIIAKVSELFGGKAMMQTHGYNNEVNTQLKQSTPASFTLVLPFQVLKTFVFQFYEDGIKSLLNDIVIEGLFNNPAYKTDFSAVVFACNDSYERITEFEKKFLRGGEFDEALITGLIHDSHKDSLFGLKLKDMVDGVNRSVKKLLQDETNNFFQLNKILSDIMTEAKKVSSDSITNLKVLMISSRNRDKAEQLEVQYPLWKVFLEIMKNYVIIGNIEKK